MQKKISVALADDHTIVRQGIRALLALESELTVVAEANSGEAAIKIASEYHPDVMLLDLMMPDMNGVEATRRIKQVNIHTQIIILTSYFDNEYILPAIRAGALSYVSKDVNVEGLVKVIRKAAKGEALLSSQIVTHIIQEVRESGAENLLDLSGREHEVMLLIAHGYSNTNIAQRLIISERTVKTHVSRIFSKLNIADRTQLAVFAWQRGLISRQHMALSSKY